MIILCDIDNTIRSSAWRDDMITNGDSWDDYHVAGFMDQPVQEMLALLRTFRWAGYKTIALTAIPEKWRQITIQWLIKYQIPFDEILMRPDDNYLPAAELKLFLAKNRIPFLMEVAFMIDDRDDVCEAFQKAGVTAFQCYVRKP